MSYDLKRSHFSVILERAVATGETITEEGQLLIATLDASTGTEVVQEAAGGASEIVCGWAIRDNADNSTTSVVENGTIPATGTLTIQLSNNNLVASTPGDGSTSQMRVVASSTGALTLVDAASPASGQCANEPATGLLTFHGDEAGQTVVVTYRYNLTVAEARLSFFQRNINNEAGALFGQVGCGHGHGEIYTDMFDATVDWSAAGVIPESAAGGTVSSGGSGASIDARVISVPNVNNPLLGLAFNIGGTANTPDTA
jgi:hypothetical protein